MHLLLVAKQGNDGGIAPTPKPKGFRRGCATGQAQNLGYGGIPST